MLAYGEACLNTNSHRRHFIAIQEKTALAAAFSFSIMDLMFPSEHISFLGAQTWIENHRHL